MFSVTSIGDVTVVEIKGEVIFPEQEKLFLCLEDLLQTGKTKIVLDLEHCTLLDSTSIGVIVTSTMRTRKQGGDIRLSGVQRGLHYKFEYLKLDFLTMTSNRKTALMTFGVIE